MGQITSSIGLVSGINTGQIIDELMKLDSQPVTLLQTRIASNNQQKSAYTDLQTQLQSLQTIGQQLQLPATFTASTAKSSDENVLTATASTGATQGTYQLQVAHLVSSQQSVSNGFTSTTAGLQAGTITVEMGGGNLNSQTDLSRLNGGQGVSRGLFRITDRSGKTDVIDTSAAVSLDDVVSKINTSLNISVRASIQNDHLVLTDSSNGTGSLAVQDLAGGASAKDLGIAGTASGNTLNGSTINDLGAATALSTLNDGRGVRTTTGTGDFTVTVSDGTALTINLGAAQTMGDVINAINTAGGSKLKASIAPGAKGLTLTDTSGGSGSFSIAQINGSHAAQDLGILKTGSGGVISGDPLIAGIDSVLVNDLKGGAGVQLGQITVTDRANHSATIDLSGAKSVQDILDTLNNAGGVQLSASLNASGNGIQIADASGGTGNLVIADANGGHTAASLGIAGTFNTTRAAVDGGNLQLQWVSENSLLSSYNGGKGVTPGSFKITNSAGRTATVDLTQGTFTRIGDVISAINSKNLGVTASINANGDGILLTDNAGGANKMKVENVTGTTAGDLNIAATATTNTIDGSFEKTIQVTSSDNLGTVQQKIQQLGLGVSANIINDGSGASPYRLSITATNSGKAGRLVIDGGATGIQVRNLVEGQDAAVFLGGTGTAQPLLITSSTNQLTGVIPGVTVSLQGASNSPVTLNIARDPTSLTTQMQKFTDTFNGIVDKITTLTGFDTTTNTAGLLLGDATLQQAQTEMYTVFNSVVAGAGTFRTIGDVGMTLTDGAKIQFDASKFQAAYAQNPDAVKNLFTQTTTGLGALINQSMTRIVDPVTGIIPMESKTLDNSTQTFQDRITELNQILADKRTRLENQFANMETVLAGLQSQQSALASLSAISTIRAPTTTSSSTTSSTSSTGA